MGEVNRQGFLTKEGGSWKSWKKRFFVLRGGDLMYSKKPEGGSLGIISLKGAGKIEPVEYKKKEFCFSLQTPERVWYMCCSSEEDRKNWVDALTKERDRVNAPPKAIPVGGTVAPPKPIGLEDFDLLKVIGKGSFGKVFQVRKKDNGQIYAMKVLNKKAIIKRGEVQHTLTEKNILKNLVHPFLVNLYFTFQTQDKLCFVMGALSSGGTKHMQFINGSSQTSSTEASCSPTCKRRRSSPSPAPSSTSRRSPWASSICTTWASSTAISSPRISS